jgi:hypothetical protein
MGRVPSCDSKVCISTWLQADLTKSAPQSAVKREVAAATFFTIKFRLCFFTSKCKQKFFVALKGEKGWGRN